MPEVLKPTSDIAVNGWTTDTGASTNLYAALDEDTASDTDYIQSPEGPGIAQFYEVAFPTPAENPPPVDTGHTIRYRYRKPGVSDQINLTASLISIGNIVPPNAYGIETDASSWQVLDSCTIARSTAQAFEGVACLAMTKIAGATYMSARPTPYTLMPVTPGEFYTATIQTRAATTARQSQLWLEYYDSAGAGLGGTNAVINNTTTGWTQITVTGTAPGTAAYARMAAQINGASVGEVHYIDALTVVGPGGAIASWVHTDIGTSWTAAAQTLSEAEAAEIADYADLSLRFIPSAVGPAEYTERHAPDSIISSSNMTNVVLSRVQDDPDSPDANWITASGTTVSGWLHVSFPTPTGPLKAGGNVQRFAALVKKQGAGTGVPTIIIDIYENGTLKASGPSQNVTSTTGQVLAIVWNPSLYITDPTAVEMRVRFTVGGSGGQRASVDIGAVEWDAAILPAATGKAQVSWANIEVPTTGGGPTDFKVGSDTLAVALTETSQIVALDTLAGTDTVALTVADASAKTVVAFQFLRPVSDNTVTGVFTNEVGGTSNLYASIDETVQSNTDFIESPSNPSNEVYRAALAAGGQPNTWVGHTLRYAVAKSASAGRQTDCTIRLRLLDGTIIAAWTHTDMTEVITTYEQTLTQAEANAIGPNYDKLVVGFDPTGVGGGAGRTARLYWVEFQAPPAVVPDVVVGSDSLALTGANVAVSTVATVARTETVAMTMAEAKDILGVLARSDTTALAVADAGFGTERMAPDAILTQTNLTGALADIQDDPDDAGGGLWTPALLPSLRFWLKADAITGLSDGAAVASWPDSSGYGHSGSQGTAINRPTYQTSILNGLPAVEFNGTHDLDISGLAAEISADDTYSLFILNQPRSFTIHPIMFTHPTTTDWNWIVEYNNFGDLYWGHVNGNYRLYDTNVAVNDWPILSLVKTAATAGIVRKSGTEITVFTPTGTGMQATPSLTDTVRMGAYYNHTIGFDGFIPEVIYCDDVLSAADIERVEGYLAHKWGRTADLPGGHTYKSAAPVATGDVTWMVESGASVLRVSFPTPVKAPLGTQEIRVRVRPS